MKNCCVSNWEKYWGKELIGIKGKFFPIGVRIPSKVIRLEGLGNN
jgi:hypothetical protein